MTLLTALVLAVVQGLTEFLPVSSSGHLALAGILMDVPKGDISFEIILHLGTLLAILAVYYQDIIRLVAGVMHLEKESLALAGFLIIGTVPAGFVGYFFADKIENAFDDPLLVSVLLLVTGVILFASKCAKQNSKGTPTVTGGILIGISQAFALLPGISRSGITISTGLFCGISREKAAKFSFLLSVPAIAGAAVLKMGEMGNSGTSTSILIVSFIVSGITGYFALRLLLGFLRRGKFAMFAWYCWAIGITGITLSLVSGS